MLKKTELLKMIVGLIQVNDAHLIKQDAILGGSVCLPGDRKRIRNTANIIMGLIEGYDYAKSPEFERETAGKSAKKKPGHPTFQKSQEKPGHPARVNA